jgi:hypothetical protein
LRINVTMATEGPLLALADRRLDISVIGHQRLRLGAMGFWICFGYPCRGGYRFFSVKDGEPQS